jgi:hypothetical protein
MILAFSLQSLIEGEKISSWLMYLCISLSLFFEERFAKKLQNKKLAVPVF